VIWYPVRGARFSEDSLCNRGAAILGGHARIRAGILDSRCAAAALFGPSTNVPESAFARFNPSTTWRWVSGETSLTVENSREHGSAHQPAPCGRCSEPAIYAISRWLSRDRRERAADCGCRLLTVRGNERFFHRPVSKRVVDFFQHRLPRDAAKFSRLEVSK